MPWHVACVQSGKTCVLQYNSCGVSLFTSKTKLGVVHTTSKITYSVYEGFWTNLTWYAGYQCFFSYFRCKAWVFVRYEKIEFTTKMTKLNGKNRKFMHQKRKQIDRIGFRFGLMTNLAQKYGAHFMSGLSKPIITIFTILQSV